MILCAVSDKCSVLPADDLRRKKTIAKKNALFGAGKRHNLSWRLAHRKRNKIKQNNRENSEVKEVIGHVIVLIITCGRNVKKSQLNACYCCHPSYVSSAFVATVKSKQAAAAYLIFLRKFLISFHFSVYNVNCYLQFCHKLKCLLPLFYVFLVFVCILLLLFFLNIESTHTH